MIAVQLKSLLTNGDNQRGGRNMLNIIQMLVVTYIKVYSNWDYIERLGGIGNTEKSVKMSMKICLYTKLARYKNVYKLKWLVTQMSMCKNVPVL